MSDNISAERWLPVVGYENSYEVSDLGRVRSMDRWVRAGTKGRLTFRAGTVLRQGTRSGYFKVALSAQSAKCVRLVHQLVLEAHVGPRPAGQFGCHNDGDCKNNRVENLRWDTPSANALDMRRHGTHCGLNRTHCPRKHPLALPNLTAYSLKTGRRTCLACSRAAAFISHRAKLGERLDLQVVSDKYYAEIMAVAARAVHAFDEAD